MDQVSGKSMMAGWLALALALAWMGVPLVLTVVGVIMSTPSQSALQNTPKLYVAIVLIAAMWLSVGVLVMLLCLHKTLPPKVLLGLLGGFVIITAPCGLWVFETWVCSVSSPEAVPTSFQREGSYRRQTRLRALDGPAAGKMFVFDPDVVASAEQLDPQKKEVRVGVVHRVRLGLWRATLNK